MLSFGAFAFAQPWLLTALLGLPAIWFLLRLIPPAPKVVDFPPIRIIAQLIRQETVAQRTPWWLLLLRMAALALVILALSGPVLNPAQSLRGEGPLLLVVDDGWASAPHWTQIRTKALEAVGEASREGREVALVRTAPELRPRPVAFAGAAAAGDQLTAAEPKAWWPEWSDTADRLRDLPVSNASILWLTDGLARDAAAQAEAEALVEQLRSLGTLSVVSPTAEQRPAVLVAEERGAGGLGLEARAGASAVPRELVLQALADDGSVLGRLERPLPLDGAVLSIDFGLPPQVMDQITRVETVPASGAGGVVLFDAGNRLLRVGLISAGLADDQPLLAERFFVGRALTGRADVETGPLEELLEAGLGTLILVDGEPFTDAQAATLQSWVETGGVLLRFAGPRLAAAPNDRLVPLPLRAGDRLLDGALSWSEPLALGAFRADGPLGGLSLSEDVRINRQVLAEPSPDLEAGTLATLADGTPLVTGRNVGDGWLMLVHTTANTRWSNFALSGSFVALLERAAEMGSGSAPATAGPLVPSVVLDGYGRLRAAPDDVPPIDGDTLQDTTLGPDAPPGYYVLVDGSGGEARNVGRVTDQPVALAASDLGVPLQPLIAGQERPLTPWLLLAALLLLLVDLLVTMLARGGMPRFGTATASAGLFLVLLAPAGSTAQSANPELVSLSTSLAFVRSGDSELDRIAEAGLTGLGMVLNRRTSVEAGEPVAVDIREDALELYPLLFWPVSANARPLDELAAEQLLAYLDGGGMVVFDTRDANLTVPGAALGSPGISGLRTMLEGIELPPLEQVGGDHALTRSFYLLQDFPGRFTGQGVWVDRAQAGVNDGVSALVIGSNDWLGAWAVDEFYRPLLPVAPGGERQREMARRFGVNLVMYALTGNYKTDQVHVPTLLERLGQ